MIDLLKPVPQVRKSRLRIHNVRHKPAKQMVARSLGFHCVGYAVPVNDSTDQYSLARGVVRRLLLQTPVVDRRMLRRFREFVRLYLRVHARKHGLEPLSRIKSFDEWVEGINHPAWRKDELREAKLRVEQGVNPRELFKNKYHGKIEHLEGAKENRGINARVDEAKVLFGPAISSVEDEVYSKIPEFVKHIPICKLASRIAQTCRRIGPEHIIATDYTSFEGHFSPELIRAAECQLYSYMLKHTDPGLARTLSDVLSGVNLCESKKLTFSVEGCRMSGDMMTSLGNGFTNLMIIKFISQELGSEICGFVEGDDGLFLVKGKVPTADWYEKLGFSIKIDVHLDPHLASFCGQVFDADTGDLVIDPIYTCLTVGWTLADQRHGGSDLMMQLLRSKGISLAYQAPRCPVIGSLARCILRLTSGYEAKTETFHGMPDWWQNRLLGGNAVLSDEIYDKLSVGPSPGSREVMSKAFGVCEDDQVELEGFFDSITVLEPWSHPVIEKLANPLYSRYYGLCIHEFPVGSSVGAPFDVDNDWRDRVDVRGRHFEPEKFPRRGFDVNGAIGILDPSVVVGTFSARDWIHVE